MTHPLETWHRLVRERDAAGLHELLDSDAVFISPVVHAPQRGRELAAMYLGAAFGVFFNSSFRYVREIVGHEDAMLEFETEIDGIVVNGVDILKWNAAGRIVEFKVMLRPLKAINLVHARMAAMLAANAPPSPVAAGHRGGAPAPASPSVSAPMQRGLAHVALLVRDYDEALAFFVGVLGFALVEDTPQPAQDKRWVVVAPPGTGGTSLLLARAATPEQRAVVGHQAAGRVFLFLATDAFERDHARLRAAGVRFVREPSREAYGQVAVFEDLYGNRWDLLQYAPR